MNSQLTSTQLTTVAGGIVGAVALISGAVMLYKKKGSDSSLENVQDEEIAHRLQQDEKKLEEDRQRLQQDEKKLEEDRRLAQQLQDQQNVETNEPSEVEVENPTMVDAGVLQSEQVNNLPVVEVQSEQVNNLPVAEVQSEQVNNLPGVEVNPEQSNDLPVAEVNSERPVLPQVVQSDQPNSLPDQPPPYSSVQITSDPARPPGGGTRKNKITKKKSRKHYAILQKVKELLKEI
jgi:hypothetical protein